MIDEIEELSQIVENANLGTWQWNILTGETKINDRWATIVGYTVAELSPVSIDTWVSLIHPDDLLKSKELLNAHFEGKTKRYSCEVRMLHKNGNWVWVLDTGKVSQWTVDGNPLMMSGIHQEIDEQKQAELQLYHKLKQEKLIREISSDFVNSSNIDDSIISVFEKLCSFVEASRVYLFMIDAKKETMSNTHEWCAEGVSAEKDELQNLPLSIFPWWMDKLYKKEIINISDVSQMPIEAKAEQEILESQNIKSLLVLPVHSGSKLIGFVGFDNVMSTVFWTQQDSQMLYLLADILSNAIIRKLNEEELTNSFKNLRNYFDLNSDFVVILNDQAEIIKVNQQVIDTLGYEEDDVVGKSVLLLHPSKEEKDAATVIGEILDNERKKSPMPIIANNGKRILVETTAKKGLWDGKPAVFVISKDISELKLSEEKFSKIFHNSPEITGLSNLDTGECLEVNSAFYSKLGFSPDEVIGKQAYTLLKMEKNIKDKIETELKEKGSLQNMETVIYTKHGKPLNVLLSSSIIQILDSKYNLTIASDITESVKNKRELIQAKEKAEESDRLKLAFLATMSHELRTPLNHVIGFSNLIPDMTDDESIMEFSKLINQSGSNLLNIIEDIFDLAMVEQSTIKIRQQEVLIRDIYLELKNQLQEILFESDKNESIQLDYRFDSTLATKRIITDKPKVMQVMTNIIKNAVKYTEKGRIALSLTLEQNSYLSLNIKDTGIGIPENKIDIIFDFFRQVDDSHTREYGGVGIGLAISQKIATAMGGKIKVKSVPDFGSEFSYSFPIKFSENKTIESNKNSDIFIMPDFSGSKVLIAEDDTIGLKMIINILKPSSCTIIEATNGLQAVEALKANPDIDMILMDLKMPVMDGFEATSTIREDFPNLPIIALTAYSLTKDKKRAFAAGCNDIITKPVDKVITFMKLKNYLER
ncbi:MAG: PAS domain S-box protein [Nonlabens sp.]|uniref:PAS domain S-box protein n=1 Tax=Nonlabens sp. TaxID=1888209 RepID=UPI0032194E8D